MIHSFVAASTRLGCAWKKPSCTAMPAFTNTVPRSGSANVPKHQRIHLCLPLPASPLSVLVTEIAVSERASGRIRGWDPWISHKGWCHSDFREDGGCALLPKSHTSESVPDYFPKLSRAQSPAGRQLGPPEPRVWVCQKPGGCFYWLSHEGEAPVCFPGKYRERPCPKDSF